MRLGPLVKDSVRPNFSFPALSETIWGHENDDGFNLVLETFAPSNADEERPIYTLEESWKGLRPRQVAYVNALFSTGGNRELAKEIAGYSLATPVSSIESTPSMRRAVSLMMQRVLSTLSITPEQTMARISSLATRAEETGDLRTASVTLKTLGEFQGLGKGDEGGGGVRIDNHGQMIVFAGQGATEGMSPEYQAAIEQIMLDNKLTVTTIPAIVMEEVASSD